MLACRAKCVVLPDTSGSSGSSDLHWSSGEFYKGKFIELKLSVSTIYQINDLKNIIYWIKIT